jgi:hypothetical protein
LPLFFYLLTYFYFETIIDNMEYKPSKTISATVEAPAITLIVSEILFQIFGIDRGVGSAAGVVIFGIGNGIINYIKNRHKK